MIVSSPLKFAVFALIAWLAPILAAEASPFYSFRDLGTATTGSGRYVFDPYDRITPVFNANDRTRTSAGDFSIGSRSWPINPSGPDQSLAIRSGQPDVVMPIPPSGFYGKPAVANSVNSTGTFVGTSADGYEIGGYHGVAFSFTIDGGLRSITGPFAHTRATGANGINEAGMIVGDYIELSDYTGLKHGGFRALLSDGLSSWDLNTLIDPGSPFVLRTGTDINDLGQILGVASDLRDGSDHYFLLTPQAVPEPTCALIVGVGISACALRRLARRRVV